jgi:hypothetical protein
MPLLSSTLANLVNGVSQQAPGLRLTSEMEIQENAYPSIVEGLGKRTPTQHIALLDSDDVSDALIHTINRDATERYTVVITDGALKVFDMEGTEKTVNYIGAAASYLASSSPKTLIKALTVEDYTFVVNTETVAAMASAPLSYNPGIQALIFVRQGQYGTDYKIFIDNFEAASYTTSTSSVTDLQTTSIASHLKDQLAITLGFSVSGGTWTESSKTLTKTGAFASYTHTSGDRIYITGGTGVTPGIYTVSSKTSNNAIVLSTSLSTGGGDLGAVVNSSTGWTLTLQDSAIKVAKTGSFAIRASDSFGDRALFAFKDSVQRFSDLPVVAPTGFLVEIQGDGTTDADNYWVRFVPNTVGQTFDKGVWVETIAPNIEQLLDSATMPHILTRMGDGTFTFSIADWGYRAAGDTDTSPDPSFVGQTINDVFFFRNRLGLLSNETVCLSEAGSFFNFFPSTVTTILDDAPIDVHADNTVAAVLKQAVPFQEELLIFAEQAQFTLSSGSGLLTANNTSCKQTTSFECSLQSRPVSLGNNIYFPFTRGDFSGMREFFIQPDSGSKDASDITAHVPKYIPGVVSKITATSTENVVVAQSDTDLASLYIYKFYWLDNQKLQSAWSKYTLEEGAVILNADFIQSTLYLVIQRDDGYHLEQMRFEPGQTDDDSLFVTRLDRRLDETTVEDIDYDSGTNITTWTLPYEITGTMRVVVRAGDSELPEGARITTLSASGTTITATGDYSSTKVFIGQVYTMRVRLSEQILREPSPGGGQVQVTAGRSQLRYMTVVYNNSVYFSTEVTPTGRDTSVKSFSGLIPGVNGPGEVNLSSGEFRFPILSQSSEVTIELVSDSHLPCYFTSAEIETFYHSRSQRA